MRHSLRSRALAYFGAILVLSSLIGGQGRAASDAPPAGATPAPPPSDETLQAWVVEMKAAPKGPFESVRWFCADGSVLPPSPYACVEHGGGLQYGVLSERARALRAQGFEIANVLASLDPARFVGAAADLDALRQLVLERFLVRWDDGWIFRRARSYRGALQIENEEAAAEALILALLADPAWLEDNRFFLLRELARALPLPTRRDVAERMRTLAAEIGDSDPGFANLRAHIHSFPDPRDAARVREYARKRGDRDHYEALASAIDEFFRPSAAVEALRPLVSRIDGDLGAALRAELAPLSSKQERTRLDASARALERIRRGFAVRARPTSRLAALRASLILEAEAFASSQLVIAGSAREFSRRKRLELIPPLASALYGASMLSARQLEALQQTVAARVAAEDTTLAVWRSELGYLARAPEWSRRWLMFQFGPALAQLARVEPEVALYEADRLRGSPLLGYTTLLDELLRDAQSLSGAAHGVLGEPVGVGLRGLNPGLARGILRQATTHEEVAALARDSVALLPETTAHLPPVAAILTLGEGSSLSHIQLLARNLGIPNAVLSRELAQRLKPALGQEVEVVVSRAGLVQIDRAGPEPSSAMPDSGALARDVLIQVDEGRLALERTDFVPLDELSAQDSGRLCGPKAANLGELRRYFGDAVPDGFVIPFGVFRNLLDRPIEVGGPSLFDWLSAQYRELAWLDPAERETRTAQLLSGMRDWIATQDPGPEFRAALEKQLADLGEGGVFVRSDTNVEDLPGFSGAGLNLTVANVVGVDAVLAAVRRVWASPFTDRAYAWRQSRMSRPELVFPSILVQHAFASEVSGVMVTADIDSGDTSVLSVAVGEGVGGAVDGQATESLRIDRATGHVRALSAATAPFATELDPAGGTRRRPASGREALLGEAEVAQLIALSDRIARMPSWREAHGDDVAADVEFAFRDGRLALLQLRPLAESRAARVNERLREVDAAWRATEDDQVELDEVPGRGPRQVTGQVTGQVSETAPGHVPGKDPL